MRKSQFFAIFAFFFPCRKCSTLRVKKKNFWVIVVFPKMYILMVRKPPSFALWYFFLPFSLYFSLFTWLTSKLDLESQSWDWSIGALIWSLRLGFELEAKIKALKSGGGMEKKKEEKEEEEKKEKVSHMCEGKGHRPLRGRCPKRIKQNATSLLHPSAWTLRRHLHL